MNKNVVIGILVVLVILILGFFALKDTAPFMVSDDSQSTTTAPGINDNTNPGPGTINTAGVPAVETGTKVVASNSTALVTGNVRPNGASTSYWYEYGTTSNLGSKTSSQNVGSSFSSISAPGFITGLRTNTQYFFRLSAVNSFGTVRGVTHSFTTNNEQPPVVKLPTVQTSGTSNVTRESATVNGRVNPQGYLTTYWFEFGETTGLGSLTGIESASNGNSAVSVSAPLPSLKPLTKYYYRLNAQNQFGTVVSATASFTTDGPAATPSPAKPEARTNAVSSVTATSATFNGRLDPNGANTTYWFEYSDDSALGRIIGTATPDQTMNGADAPIGVKADVSGLERNTRYYYRLVARNSEGTVMGSVVNFRTDR